MLRHIFVEKLNGKRYKVGGLKREKPDPKDFQLGWLFGSYKPKHKSHVIKTVSVKDQYPFNTCTQASATVQKEVDEGIELSEQSLTCFAKSRGMISGDGFSTLTRIQKMLKEHGICKKNLLNGTKSWQSYSSSVNLTKDVRDDAEKHKIQSYWSANSRQEKLKALDDGRVLHTGMDWYSGFNQSGGMSSPWMITGHKGIKVGGHAVVIIGYDLDYFGHNVYILQNSYSDRWGDNGKFYVDMDYFDLYGHASYAQVDIPVDAGHFIREYGGKQVKAKGRPMIFKIEGGKKRSFVDKAIFYAHGGRFGENRSYEFVDEEVLDQIPQGEDMTIQESPIWPKIEGMWEELKVLNSMNYWAKLETILDEYNGFQIKEQINSLMK